MQSPVSASITNHVLTFPHLLVWLRESHTDANDKTPASRAAIPGNTMARER